jgi:hypothetical protein
MVIESSDRLNHYCMYNLTHSDYKELEPKWKRLTPKPGIVHHQLHVYVRRTSQVSLNARATRSDP